MSKSSEPRQNAKKIRQMTAILKHQHAHYQLKQAGIKVSWAKTVPHLPTSHAQESLEFPTHQECTS